MLKTTYTQLRIAAALVHAGLPKTFNLLCPPIHIWEAVGPQLRFAGVDPVLQVGHMGKVGNSNVSPPINFCWIPKTCS
jgi:hypothetical protein